MPSSTIAQTPSSSSASFSSAPTNWDVFLSFRGEDTRYNFTSHLYSALDRHGLRTFMDDPELRSGEVISDALLKAIQESKSYIVVLSENYASSSWCLDELVEILNCHKTMQRLVIPVFYKIDPSIVRRQTGRFEQAFEKHEFRFVGELGRVKNWRLSLGQVSDKSGKHIYEKRSEADVINEIVDEILLKLNPTALDVAKYPVGLDSRVKAITTLLSNGTKGVIKFGIYGMGGVGKTTLAKALFNQLLLENFKGSCFLANVREISGTFKGLQTLQEQLVNDVLKIKKKVEIHSVEQGTNLIGARICSAKILVVIDDLDDHKQFETLVGPFASGSVLILTTRNEEILDKIEVETKYRYRVNELDDAESLALFSRHAFRDTKPDNTLMVLSKDIIRYAGGLPLALEVFGSYLYMRSERGWKSYIEKLQRIPNSSIQQRLIVSLDALESDDPMLKKMFLDIACFFIGRKKEHVAEIMETYYSYADDNIDILKKRCLLTINYRDELRMHDLLRDMGREIARNNYPDEPGKHSRLWVSKDICNVLKKHEGTEAIEGIKLEYEDPIKEVSFATEAFRRMRKLRFLHLKGISLTGNFEQTLEDLRWFHWDGCPLKCLPFNFFPKKLVILELPNSKMTILWEVNMVFKKLKTLNMSFSRDLTTPNFTKLPYLETLDLEGCESLEEVHTSIGSLESLVFLNLSSCHHLVSIPKLPPHLKQICADGCRSMKILPNLSNLKQLKILDITDCISLTEIVGLEELTSLEELHLTGCNSSLLAYTLTKCLFQIYFGFGHTVEIYTSEFPDWISPTADWNSGQLRFWRSQSSWEADWNSRHPRYWTRQSSCEEDLNSRESWYWTHRLSCEGDSGMSLKLPPNVSHNLLGMILCFQRLENHEVDLIDYYVENTTSRFSWYGCFFKDDYSKKLVVESMMVLVPRSIFPIKDGDKEIKLGSIEADINGIHLMYKSEYDSTTVDVENEKSNPLFSDLEINKNRLSLGSTTVNVEEETRYPSKRLKRLQSDNWLSL